MDKRQKNHSVRPEHRPILDRSHAPVVRRIAYADGDAVPPHWHERAQLLFAVEGTMAVRTERCAWMVPASRALWIPAGAVHEIGMHGDVEMRTLYLHADEAAALWPDCVVLEVTPLLRELLVRSAEATVPDPTLMQVLVAEIATLRPCAFDLPLPKSDDLLGLCRRFMADLETRRTASDDAVSLSQSPRTLYRRFRAETGISLARWKQQARLLESIRRLSAGAAVTTVAFDLGYRNPGAFSTMFRRALGTSPSRFTRRT